jgi:SAM-dependent methyltransferase
MEKSQHGFLCPVCQYEKCSILGPYIAKSEPFKGRELAKCLQCNAVSMYPCFLECISNEYYSTQYWTDEIFNRRLPALRVQAHARCLFIQPAVTSKTHLRILDVGAGVGYMNWGLRRVWADSQIEYTAVEVNPAAVNYLRLDPGVNHIASDLDEVNESFDIIVLSHILEHITDPVKFLGKIFCLLNKSGGCVFVEVPNMDYMFKNRNEPHVIFYSPESLSSVLTRPGIQVVRVETCGHTIWKKRADAGLAKSNILLSLKKLLYNLVVRPNREYCMYGGNRQWIRAVCKSVV